MKRFLVLYIFLHSIFVYSETLILKNGSLLTGQIMEYRRDKGIYVFNTYKDGNRVDKILDVKLDDVEAVILNQVETGIKGNWYTNFKYGFKLSRPDKNWFFNIDKTSTEPFIKIARKTDSSPEDVKFRFYILGPYQNIPQNILKSDSEYQKYLKDFMLKYFKMYIGYEDGVKSINGIKYYWRVANHFIFTRMGKEIKMKYRQYATVRGQYIYVMDYCDDEKKFDRETLNGPLVHSIESFQYLNDNNIYLQLCNIYYYQKDYNKALNYIKRAIDLQNDRWELYQKMGDIYGHLGLMKDAVNSFREAVRLGGDETLLKFQLDNVDDAFYNGVY